jgi:putative transcription factor
VSYDEFMVQKIYIILYTIMVTDHYFVLDAAGSNAVGGGDAGKNLAKLENDSETFAVAKVNASLSKAIQQARISKSMTQKALATAINEKPQVIQQYESGQAIPNPQILNKLDRALGIHLPRNKKK